MGQPGYHNFNELRVFLFFGYSQVSIYVSVVPESSNFLPTISTLSYPMSTPTIPSQSDNLQENHYPHE